MSTGLKILPPGLSEIVTLRHKTGSDQYGDPTYSDSLISVIWFDRMKETWEGGQRRKICDAFCLIDDTSITVSEGDAITRGGYTWPVLSIEPDNGYGFTLTSINLGK